MPDPAKDREKITPKETRKPDFKLEIGKPLTLVKGQWEAGVSIGSRPTTEPLGREMPRQKAVLVPDPTGEIFNLPVGVTLKTPEGPAKANIPGNAELFETHKVPESQRVFAEPEEHNLTVQRGVQGKDMLIWNTTNNEKVIYENGKKITIHPHNFYNASGRVTHMTGEHHFIELNRQGDNLKMSLKTTERPGRDETVFYKVTLDEEKFRQVPISADDPKKPLIIGFRPDSKAYGPEHGAVLLEDQGKYMKEGPRHLLEVHWDPGKKALEVRNLAGPGKVYALLKANGTQVSFDSLLVDQEITLWEPTNKVRAELRILDRYRVPPLVVWRFSKG